MRHTYRFLPSIMTQGRCRIDFGRTKGGDVDRDECGKRESDNNTQENQWIRGADIIQQTAKAPRKSESYCGIDDKS
jgi:hypothetical protein